MQLKVFGKAASDGTGASGSPPSGGFNVARPTVSARGSPNLTVKGLLTAPIPFVQPMAQ